MPPPKKKKKKKKEKSLRNKFILIVKRKTLAQCQQKRDIKRKLGDAIVFLKQWLCCCKKCLVSQEAATVLWDKERSETLQQGCCVRGQSAASSLPQAGSGWGEWNSSPEPRDGCNELARGEPQHGFSPGIDWNNPSFCTLGMQEPKLF